MKLAKNLHIPAVEYASQGNAILGIRDSGKSYTATKIAESLLEAGIPFIAFDPIGVWRYLKLGKDGKPGCQIVVAGENADLELTVESAPKIIRAAMKENVPLILDLYSMKLSKADWRHIVQECIQILLYENKTHGLRHIFIEEAAEFCPQRVGPDSGRVYAEIEKLARMGGNASLGYTLINQRAEEVNKAVLELCDCLFLHRQKGRHSLTALGKWLDVADAEGSRDVIKSMPALAQGECWVWQQGSQQPIKVKILPKNTTHPDRRNPTLLNKAVPVDVSQFVDKLLASIIDVEASPKKTKEKTAKKQEAIVDDPQIISLHDELIAERRKNQKLIALIEKLRKHLQPQFDSLKMIFDDLNSEHITESAMDDNWSIWLGKLSGKNRDMLKTLIDHKQLTRQQLSFHVGMSSNSGSFNTYLSKLKSLGLVEKQGDKIVLRHQ